MVCASTVPGRARSPASNASKRSRPRRAPCATIAVRFIAPVGLPLVSLWWRWGPLPVGAHSKRLARELPGDDCSGNGQVRGQIETTAATRAIPSGYVKPRRDAARGIATRTAHTAATGVHVLIRIAVSEYELR